MQTETIHFFFGGQRRLFASYHPSSVRGRQYRGVLLCNPFGQEALRAHRLYRVLAERLARSGIDVMRFDYYGSGDSYGNDDEGEMTGWARDLRSAHEELVMRASLDHVTWVGVRLGATLALAAGRPVSPRELRQFVLVDPILDGPAYSRSLRHQHVARLESVFRQPTPEWRRELQSNPNAFELEASGFGLAPHFHSQLAQITTTLGISSATPGVTVLFDPEDSATMIWQSQCSKNSPIEWVPMVHGFDWNAHEAVEGMLLPEKVLRELTNRLLK